MARWRWNGRSQLLRAEEAVLPFDPARQPEVDSLNPGWMMSKATSREVDNGGRRSGQDAVGA